MEEGHKGRIGGCEWMGLLMDQLRHLRSPQSRPAECRPGRDRRFIHARLGLARA
jgi:hypothetical protein